MSSSSSSSSGNSCKISMLWNWNTVDSCFIARLWHVRSKGAFAGSCIGVFLLVVASQWLHRFAREYDVALIKKYSGRSGMEKLDSELLYSDEAPNVGAYTLSHRWMLKPLNESGVKPNVVEHLVRTSLFTVEWGVSYIIMLLFMYYNGYIIISCILGAFFGRFLFTYSEPLNGACLSDSQDMDRKCCR